MKDKTFKTPKVFYGWWIVGAVFLISGYTSGVVFLGFTALFEPIAEEFGWSYAQISLAASIRGVETSLFAPLIGLLLDRFGPRKPIFTGAVIMGLGLLFLSRSTSLMMLYGAFILISLGASTCGGLILATVVGYWFRRKLSTATGIALCGSAFGGLLVPLVTQIIDVFEWRTAMVIFGFAAWGIILPLSFLLRHKPEQYGQLPDGDISGKLVSIEEPSFTEDTQIVFGPKQALKNRAFWHISLACMCHALAAIAVVTHVMPYLSSISISRSTSSLVASAIALTGVPGRLVFGWYGDKYDKRLVTSASFALIILSLFFFVYIDKVGVWLLVPFIILFGMGWGGCIPMQPALLREYFGSVRLGTILGLSLGVTMLGQIVGPPIAGWTFDRFGSYHGAWFAFIGILIVGIVGMLTTPSAKSVRRIANSLKG